MASLFPIFLRDVRFAWGNKKRDKKPARWAGKAEGQQMTGGSEFFTSWLASVALWGIWGRYSSSVVVIFSIMPDMLSIIVSGVGRRFL